MMPHINRINEQLAGLADGRQLWYIDIRAKLAHAGGRLFPGMMGDGLHPTQAGYQLWTDALRPIFTELARAAGRNRSRCARRREIRAPGGDLASNRGVESNDR